MSGKVAITIIRIRILVIEEAGQGQMIEALVACLTLTAGVAKVRHQFLLRMQIKILINSSTQEIIQFIRIIIKSTVMQNITMKILLIKILRVILMIIEGAASRHSKTSQAWAQPTHPLITRVNSIRITTSLIASIAIMTASGSNHLNASPSKCLTHQANSIMGHSVTREMKEHIQTIFIILVEVTVHPIHSKVKTTPTKVARENIIMKETMEVEWINACRANNTIKTIITKVVEEEATAMVIVVAAVI
jgi:hypothetical protein